MSFSFLKGGDLFRAAAPGGIMINQLLPHDADGSPGNLYLRVHGKDGIQVSPLLGIRSVSTVSHSGNQMVWRGETLGIRYLVRFTLTDQAVWFWDVLLEGYAEKADVIYGQDIGLAAEAAVRSNEAYLSQYIDHAVFQDETKGWVVCSRQNQPQSGAFPYLQQGSLTKAAGFSTDGFQFFGLSYKETDRPESLYRESLANEVYQYEFAYTALQTAPVTLCKEARFVFYGLYRPDHPERIGGLEFAEEIEAAWESVRNAPCRQGTPPVRVELSPELGEPLETLPLSAEELDRYFPRRRQEEWEDGKLLSFFTDTYEHVVLKEKELRVERPHGHILMSGNNDRMTGEVLTSTSYMYGIFNSQVVVGNTSFNKMISHARSALNVAKTSGQRIYVMTGGRYRLLALPSAFEIGLNAARWYYKWKDDLLVITSFTRTESPELVLSFVSAGGKPYRCLVTHQVTMNVNEFEVPYRCRREGQEWVFTAHEPSLSLEAYPRLQYRLGISGTDAALYGDERLFAEAAGVAGTVGVAGAAGEAGAVGVRDGEPSSSLAVFETGASSSWTMKLQGCLEGRPLPESSRSAEEEIEAYRRFLDEVMNGFRLTGADGAEGGLFKVNALARWYTHNMLVHYSVPHGLEQYGGAAWGTRDVCQGPVEYFMATGKYDRVREILLTVYAHQYEDDGSWPQWFMFDNYARIQQEESHGDIIVWPLKVLGDYLSATRDYGILQEPLSYTRKGSFAFTEEQPTLLEHVEKQIGYMREHFLAGTHLSSYGDGDWDDTLQPANSQLRTFMASSWTVALTCQTLNRFAKAMSVADPAKGARLQNLADAVREDFNRYMLEPGVIPGFLYMEHPGEPKPMLHPDDKETGIQYRLLPMTRSMISELMTPEQADKHVDIIERELLFPDGVRLMNRPAHYAGGVSTKFKRAEQAANFGREIGLMYVHAHIRYVEAMAKLGKTERVWDGLAAINPVGIRENVPNAALRQANAYFSSSDGQFHDRYEAQERFGELRTGAVPVKAGWRIYSSGPGIYMNQLISNALGIRQEGGDLILDPVLPDSLDGMRFVFRWSGYPMEFVYRLTGGKAVSRVTVNGRDVPFGHEENRYRIGGARIKRKDLAALRQEERNTVEIFL